jgi:hypothetical protein
MPEELLPPIPAAELREIQRAIARAAVDRLLSEMETPTVSSPDLAVDRAISEGRKYSSARHGLPHE